VAAERLVRILGLVAGTAGSGPRRLCEVAAQVTGATGAGIMLLPDGQPPASLCTSDDVSSSIEEAQFALGDGPCIEAHRTGSVVSIPDLATADHTRWVALVHLAREAGVQALFGYPVRIGTVRLGTLSLYRDRPGPLDDDQHTDALVTADVAARVILATQAGVPLGNPGAALAEHMELWPVVHQAAGMVSVQLDISVADALVRLRARAFGVGRPLSQVARDVVERRLTFDGDA
jgi:hypothetical protein